MGPGKAFQKPGQQGEEDDIAAQLQNAFQSAHDTGICDFEADLRSGCLFFCRQGGKGAAAAGEKPEKDRDAEGQKEGWPCKRRPAQAFRHAEAYEKGRTYIVAEAQEIVSFFDRNVPGPHKLPGDPGACGETAEKAGHQAEAPLPGAAKDLVKDRIKEAHQRGDAVQGDEQGGQDKEGQKDRHQGVEPEQKPGCGGFRGADRIKKQKGEQEHSGGDGACFFQDLRFGDRTVQTTFHRTTI